MQMKWIVPLLAIAVAGTGCISMPSQSMVQEKMQLISAGYTGCEPADNVLTNLAPRPDGSGTWNASCKGQVYLCSTASTVQSNTYHCAPVAK